MAIALVPRFVQEIKLDNISPQHWIILAIMAVQRQGWQLRFYSGNGFIAFMQVGSQTYQLTANILYDTITIESKTANGHMADWGQNKKNIAAFLTGLEQEQAAYTTEQLDELYAQVSTNFPPPEADAVLQAQNAPKEKPINLLSIFIPRKGFWITPLIIDLNVLVFILMTAMGADMFTPTSTALLSWGANYKPLTLGGEWWRLLTSCFLHIGILHLFMNMFALIFIGVLLEAKLGRLRFLTAYLLTGIAASVTSLYWHDISISAGASGAIFGMYGVFLAMLTTNLISKADRKKQLIGILVFIVYNLTGGLKAGVDNAAHIGGLLGGMLIGYVFYAGLKKQATRAMQLGSILVVSLVILVSSFFVLRSLPNDFKAYDKIMMRYNQNENETMAVYKQADSLAPEIVLPYINTAITKWEQNILLADSAGKLDLPNDFVKRNNKLRYYSAERLATFKLLYLAKKENTDKYKAELQLHYNHIDSVMRILNVR